MSPETPLNPASVQPSRLQALAPRPKISAGLVAVLILAGLGGLGLNAGDLGLPEPLTEALITFAVMWMRGEPSRLEQGSG